MTDNTDTTMITSTATRSGQSAAVHADLLAAAQHLRCVLDALSRRRTNDSVRDLDAEAPREEEEALKDIYGLALDGWFEFDAPGSTMTDDWLRRLVEDERLPMATARAAAVVMAAREVYDAAVAAGCDGDRPTDEAIRRMVRVALHVLGPEVLRGVLATSPSGHHVRYLREISSEALAAGNLERVIAAFVIPMAGVMMSDAVADETGRVGMCGRDPESVIRAQRCSGHDVFCCPACPDARS